jgi:NAD(P)-dependent dehydrogenase (short-subunit alcohol dehydrogenase family)
MRSKVADVRAPQPTAPLVHVPLTGRHAVVTGATGGLGKAIAEALAALGARLTLVARSAGALDRMSAEFAAKGLSATPLPLDLTDAPAVRSGIASLGRIDILVNAAGTNVPRPIEEVTDEQVDLMLGLNLKAVIVAIQAAVAQMARGGVVLNLSSQMGHVGAPSRSVYCASKHGVEGLTKALGVELAPRGIRVVSLGPTFVETPMTRPMFEDEAFRESVLGRIPAGRMACAEDVARAAAFLVSDAAAMITGTSLIMDGGWTAQ